MSKSLIADKVFVDIGLTPNGKTTKFITSSVAKHMDKYVPYDEGNLRKNISIESKRIIYESPYASYQYCGKLMVMDNGKGAYYSPTYGFWSDKGKKKHLTNIDLHYHTAGTGSYWDERCMTAEKDTIIREIQNYINRGG